MGIFTSLHVQSGHHRTGVPSWDMRGGYACIKYCVTPCVAWLRVGGCYEGMVNVFSLTISSWRQQRLFKIGFWVSPWHLETLYLPHDNSTQSTYKARRRALHRSRCIQNHHGDFVTVEIKSAEELFCAFQYGQNSSWVSASHPRTVFDHIFRENILWKQNGEIIVTKNKKCLQMQVIVHYCKA